MHNPDLIILMIITISFIAGASSSSLMNESKPCLWIRFKNFWDTRKECWLGTDIDLVENILTDPDFLEGIE